MARRQTGGRIRAAIFLLVSLVAALVASMVIYTVINNYQRQLAEAQAPEETIQVVVAAKELHQGVTIGELDLEMKELPPAYVPDSVFRTKEEVMGRVPRERVLSSELVRQERLADPEAGVGLNAIIPRGMRAVSININDGAAVSGFLNPGNYVDVLVTVMTPDGKAETVTLQQAVKVLAVNDRLGSGRVSSGQGGARASVTLAVTPEQAEKVAHALASGAVTMTLRNDIDVTHVETHGSSVSELIGKSEDSRMSVGEWNAAAAASGGGGGGAKKSSGGKKKDGSLLIIRGSDATRENVRR